MLVNQPAECVSGNFYSNTILKFEFVIKQFLSWKEKFVFNCNEFSSYSIVMSSQVTFKNT